MRSALRLFLISAMFLLLPFLDAFAQIGWRYCGGNFNPDSLTQVTVSGTVIIDSTMMQPMYYLDSDSDGIADYHLNFGPWWYRPQNSNATRPLQGATVSINGGLASFSPGSTPIVVVYDVNGAFWRDPYDAFWNSMGHHEHSGGHFHGGCMGYAFGEMHDTLRFISISGHALVDSTFNAGQYYLDLDADDVPDYYLNFGPPWYQPSTGAMRPVNGAPITVFGGMVQTSQSIPMLVVFEINGKQWRDTTDFHCSWSGQWVNRSMNQARMICTPFDRNSWMRISPGWHSGNMMMPSSMFCQILELNPLDLPYGGMPGAFACYEMGVFTPNGGNGMWGSNGGGCGGSMRFNSNVEYQMHYNEIQLMGSGIDENTITANYWDNNTNRWVPVSGAVLDPVANTITFSNNLISNFIVLSGQSGPMSVRESVPHLFNLEQNFPNPFNPGTEINFELRENAAVRLSVYDARGVKRTELLNEQMPAGSHTVHFDGTGFETGVYFYELRVDGISRVNKMVLLK